MTNVLLTFTGFHDPYFKGLVDQEEQRGPILSILSARSFERVFLFDTPTTRDISSQTSEAIKTLFPKIDIAVLDVKIGDPTDYRQILNGLRSHTRRILSEIEDGNFHVAVASGTPHMHACWLLLTASGELPAKILHVRPPKYVSKDRPLVSDVDLSFEEFPAVRFPQGTISIAEGEHADLGKTLLDLGIVGDHPAMRRAIETGAILADSQAPIMILGETGTGKELFAHLIHQLSDRKKGPFIAINCATIPEGLVESILFGHVKGSFTGAFANQVGKFDAAANGTLFLDELGELPLIIQVKLLRILQDGMVEPIGNAEPHKVNVRIVGATNRNIRKQVRQGKFREDLFYRLNVGEIMLPPLRERRSDIPKLSLAILDRINSSLRRPKRLTPAALIRLQTYDWPGNVRDLENVIERSARLCRTDGIDAKDLLITEPISDTDSLDILPNLSDGFSLETYLGSVRKKLMLRALEISNNNQSQAARLLGITPQAVHKFLQQTKTNSSTGA